MTTHAATELSLKVFTAIVQKALAENKSFNEVRDSIVYNADNPGNLDVGKADGSNDDTFLFNAQSVNNPRDTTVDFSEGRYALADNDKGYRIQGFENFTTDQSKDYSNRTFNLTGDDQANTFTVHSGKSNIKAAGGNDTMRVYAGAEHTLHGGEGNTDTAVLKGGDFSLVDIELDNQAGPEQGRWLVFSDGANETRIHESTEFVDNGDLTKFKKLWRSHRTTLNDPDPNARREFNLEGTFKNEDFRGGRGADIFTGAGGADHFYLESSHKRARGERYADTITDFSKSDKDKMVIDVSEYGLDLNNADLKIARNSRKAEKALAKDDVDFVYDRSTGMLSWNRNGGDPGDGGGLLAIIEGSDSGSLKMKQFDLI